MNTELIYNRVLVLVLSAVPSPPTAPLEVRAIGVNTSIFEWGIPESDGGAPLEGYNIAIRDLKRTMWIEVGRVGPDTQRFQIRDLQEDHEYLIRIFARNEVGLSEPLESDEPYKVLPMTGKSSIPSHFIHSLNLIPIVRNRSRFG